MKFTITKKLAYTTVLAGLAAPAAFAQAADNPFFRNRYVAVTDRPQPEYDSQPLHVGAFNLTSSLGVGANYNDNVYAATNNTTEDTFIQFRPRAEMNSNWSTHALNFGFSADHREYLNEDSETVTDGDAFVSGRLDVQRNFSIGGRVTGARLSEMRYDPASQQIGFAAAEPTRFDRFTAQANADWRTGRIELTGEVGTIDTDYDNIKLTGGGIANQDYRDVEETFYGGRASYAVSPDVALFAQGRVSDLNYDEVAGIITRDGSRSTAQVGVNFELQAPFRGDIAVGYIEDDKDSPLLTDFDGLSVDGNLSWFPTQLTTVSFRGSRSVYDPGILASATAALTVFGARVDHELRRNIIIYGDVSFAGHDFQGIDRQDDVNTLGLGLGYKLNRNVRLDFGYTRYNVESSGVAAGFDLDQNIVSVGLRFVP